jgi:hypothetical protein
MNEPSDSLPGYERPLFIGHDERSCGEHRTLGSHRAWCFDCGEYCYPNIPCSGCSYPIMRRDLTLILGRYERGDTTRDAETDAALARIKQEFDVPDFDEKRAT